MIRILALATTLAATAASAEPQLRPGAETVRRYPAPEARQGVAVDARFVYAVANSTIAKYDKQTGAKVGEWKGDRARFPHINSCSLIAKELVCASSNFPAAPHWSAVEIYDPATMTHRRSVPLGPGTGSVTWVEWKDGAWYTAFANYDGKGGEAGRDHTATALIRYDAKWRRTGGWLFPASVLARMAPMSSSGGGFGPDGRLYVTGHDNAELYVLELPKDGAVLDHVATLPIEAEGQAIDWDEGQPWMLYGISRKGGEILAMKVPPAPVR
ncbi:hypothetical protein [Phenylobacterium immobile]|uniref:hypothetical protein n=1 Tax=Phenylobacterium immobile TaxID=21 RepID=UPI000B280850|nr:hypothetical protein [Phenylobacterium immobile]